MPEHARQLRKSLDSLRERSDNPELIALVETLLDRWESEHDAAARTIGRLTQNLQALDARLLTVENSRIFRLLQRFEIYSRMWRSRYRRYVLPGRADTDQKRTYQLWLEKEQLRRPHGQWFLQAQHAFSYVPRFSILMHVYKPQRNLLVRAVEAITSQNYPHWELCISDDGSAEQWVPEYFKSLAEQDSRVQYVRSEQEMGAGSSLNRAGMLGSGDYLVCLGQHDVLSAAALYHAGEALQQRRFDLLYGDGDRIDHAGQRTEPCFRPGWSPDLLTSSMYLGKLLIMSRRVFEAVEGFRNEAGEGYLFDLALRLAEQSVTVQHVAHLLSSTGDSKSSIEDERRALRESIKRRGWDATVTDAEAAGLPAGFPPRFNVRRKLNGTPLASIIICSRDAKLLQRCLKSIDDRTSYPVRERVIVHHKSGEDAAMQRLLERSHCIPSTYAGPFDFASMNNQGARSANGEVLVFLNDDVEPLSADWLSELLAQVQRPEVGIAGARLLYPSGAIQHAGISLGLMDGAGHPDRGTFGKGFWQWSRFTRNVTAVTGACLAIRRKVFEELGGFDPIFPVNYNDVDLCLRARQAGYEVILESSAVLNHLESRSRTQGVSWSERELFFERWGEQIERGDPYYNRHLTRSKEDCSLAEG